MESKTNKEKLDTDSNNHSNECDENIEQFYENAKKYWSEVPATVDGMLGGFGYISETDIKGSRNFLYSIFKISSPPNRNYAIDCGAGIGRITKHLLLPVFDYVDMVEQNGNFIKNSKKYIGRLIVKVKQQYVLGLQDFIPKENFYDVIWCQWVLGHLKEEDLLTFLRRCGLGLKSNGVLVIKENVTSSDEIEVDTLDSSVTRPYSLLLELFEKADLVCIKSQKQTNFPKGLYSVHMFALRPRNSVNLEVDISDINELNKQLNKVNISENYVCK